LFKTIDIFPFKESFEWIAANPEIQRSVRCVRYIMKALPHFEGEDLWQMAGVGSNLGPFGYPGILNFPLQTTSARYSEAYKKYCNYLDSQAVMLQGDNELRYLTKLFGTLSGLREFQLLRGRSRRLFEEAVTDLKETHIIT